MEQSLRQGVSTGDNESGKNHCRLRRFLEAVEQFLDAGDAVRRRRTANRIYKDLIAQRIGYDRATLELKSLNKRQKGGWLVAALSQMTDR